jgi:hypothetical protein
MNKCPGSCSNFVHFLAEKVMSVPMVHQFGILDPVDTKKTYNDYTPEKYDCISVHDDTISLLADQLSTMKTYFHSFDRPERGLAWYGITIIPPESLSSFHDAVTSSEWFGHSDEFRKLAAKIMQAKRDNKPMIHFGI